MTMPLPITSLFMLYVQVECLLSEKPGFFFLSKSSSCYILNKAFKLLAHIDLRILKLLIMTDLQKYKKSLDNLAKSFYFSDEGTEI